MAKKKKAVSAVKVQPKSAPRSTELGAVVLWLGAASGVLFVLAYLAVPWVSVSASGMAGVSLVSAAVKGGNHVIAGALLFALVPGLLAAASPFVPAHRPGLREWVATITAIAAFVEGLIIVVLSSSTRNLLALGGGRQILMDEVWLLYITLAGVLTGAVGFLVLRDVDLEHDSGEAFWYAAFLVAALAVLFFNYSVIPDSLIPPPDFIRERMEMLG